MPHDQPRHPAPDPRHGTASHLEQLLGKYQRVCRKQEQQAEAVRETSRELSYYQDEDGMWVIRAKLPPEAGALVVKAIEALVAPLQERQREEALAAGQAGDAETPEDPGECDSAESSAADLRQLAPNVTPQTCVPRWYGERCDYGMAVDGLLRREGASTVSF